MKQDIRILIEVLIGMIISALLNFALITIGYFQFDQKHPLDVNFLGITIYKIAKKTGEPNITNMVFIGIIFSTLAVIIGEIWVNKKGYRT